MSRDFPMEQLERLTRQIVSGRVVFFIGAGFSVDFEKNTGKVLIARLLARFVAFASVIERQDLLGDLASTFWLDQDGGLVSIANINQLLNDYYSINDWMCSAFAELLVDPQVSANATKLAKRIAQLEQQFRQALNGKRKPYEYDAIKLSIIPLTTLCKLARSHKLAAGKILFLDTMGFDHYEVMRDLDGINHRLETVRSFQQRVGKRHLVLARLARENLTPILLTTNYDTLLEAGYHMTGFLAGQESDAKQPYSTPKRFDCVAGPHQFTKKGAGHETALIVKIHGCVQEYRAYREELLSGLRKKGQDISKPLSYLPQMVFTFREIQNWRKDYWSRDYLCTLLRTRTIAMLGYSGRDQVIHDTFRSIYEEMAHCYQQFNDCDSTSDHQAKISAPIYYFDGTTSSFHAGELLRAASKAVSGKDVEFKQHPNYVAFNFKGDGFPDVDQILVWCWHRTVRLKQLELVEYHLPMLVRQVLQHPVSQQEHAALVEKFKQLCEFELHLLNTQPQTHTFECITNWSYYFHAGLLREFSMAAGLVPLLGYGRALNNLREGDWYFPMNESPIFALWAVVIEMAVRNMAQSIQKTNTQAPDKIYSAADFVPTLFFAADDKTLTPHSLSISLLLERAGLHKTSTHLALRHKPLHWAITADVVPWRKQDDGNTPGADSLWRWACGVTAEKNYLDF